MLLRLCALGTKWAYTGGRLSLACCPLALPGALALHVIGVVSLDEGNGVALLSALISDSFYPACVGMRTLPPHGLLKFVRAPRWGLCNPTMKIRHCIASLRHLILWGTTQKVGWLHQGGIGKFWISWSNAIIMLLQDHPLIVLHFFIPKYIAQRPMVLLSPSVRQALRGVIEAFLPIIAGYRVEEILEVWRKCMLMFEKRCALLIKDQTGQMNLSPWGTPGTNR